MTLPARFSLLAATVLVAVSCGPGTSAVPTGPSVDGGASFVVTSTAFEPGGAIPARFTCDGEDVSPNLAWAGAPAATGAFVLVVDDPDAGGFVHWIAYNLAGGASGSLPEDVRPSPGSPPQGTNDFGKVGWGGPCPPSGEHRYRFTLTALAEALPLSGTPRAAEVRDALGKATILATATLEGRYARP